MRHPKNLERTLLPSIAVILLAVACMSSRAEHQSAEELMIQLNGANKGAALETFMKSPGAYPPPVFFVVAEALFDAGDYDDAVFWYFAADLRGREDVQKCEDLTSASVLPAIKMNYSHIARHALLDLEGFKEDALEIVRWDEATPRNYDQLWACSHGLSGITTGGPAQGKEPSEWAEIERRTRDAWLKTVKTLTNNPPHETPRPHVRELARTSCPATAKDDAVVGVWDSKYTTLDIRGDCTLVWIEKNEGKEPGVWFAIGGGEYLLWSQSGPESPFVLQDGTLYWGEATPDSIQFEKVKAYP